MAVDRVYRCDLCRDMHQASDLIGLYWTGAGKGSAVIQKPAHQVEHHICAACLASLQKFPSPAEPGGNPSSPAQA